MYLRIGRWRMPVPRLLSVAARAIQTADPATPDQIHIDLSLVSPLLGPVFGYRGTFLWRDGTGRTRNLTATPTFPCRCRRPSAGAPTLGEHGAASLPARAQPRKVRR